MKTIIRLAGIMILLWAAGLADNAQESQADHAVVSFSNTAKPGTVEVDISEGSITVRGYEGKDVIIDARWREKSLTREEPERIDADLPLGVRIRCMVEVPRVDFVLGEKALKVKHPGDVFKKGDRVKAVVLTIDSVNRRISLGVLGNGRSQWYFWKMLFRSMVRYPRVLPEAMTLMAYGHHFRKVAEKV